MYDWTIIRDKCIDKCYNGLFCADCTIGSVLFTIFIVSKRIERRTFLFSNMKASIKNLPEHLPLPKKPESHYEIDDFLNCSRSMPISVYLDYFDDRQEFKDVDENILELFRICFCDRKYFLERMGIKERESFVKGAIDQYAEMSSRWSASECGYVVPSIGPVSLFLAIEFYVKWIKSNGLKENDCKLLRDLLEKAYNSLKRNEQFPKFLKAKKYELLDGNQTIMSITDNETTRLKRLPFQKVKDVVNIANLGV